MEIDAYKIPSSIEIRKIIYKKNMRDGLWTPKTLSDYADHITSEDEALFENVKNEQLSKASSQNSQWAPMDERVDDLGTAILLLSSVVASPDKPTKNQIYFWAMFDALNEYMLSTRLKYLKTEVRQQLIMDMAMQFCKLIVDGMSISAEAKSKLQEAMRKIDLQETLLRDELDRKHPARPLLTILEAAVACKVSEKTIYRWEKFCKGKSGGTRPPYWYPGRNVTAIELRKRREIAESLKRVGQATRQGIKKASPLN